MGAMVNLVQGDASATLVWFASPGETREAPPAESRRALDQWARAHEVTLAMPAAEDSRVIGVDLAVSDRVEQELERAREAVAAQDADAAERALARAESDLYAHPELPHAAWLLAEVERGWAVRYTRLAPMDEARAERAWLRAAGLDGGRAAGIGEPQVPGAGGAVVTVHASIAVVADGALTLWLDGAELAAGSVDRSPAAHQLLVTRDGAPVWAAWVTLAEGTAVRVALAPSAPCTISDVAHARVRDNAIEATGVRCPRWIAARPTSASGVLIASCEAERCGALVEWRAPAAALPPSPPKPRTSTWPSWATWTIVGGATALAAGVVLAASGALQPARTETRFINGGIKTQATPVTHGLSFGF